MAYIRRGDKPEANFRSLANICLHHKDGDCMAAMERLAGHLGLSPREKLRLRHLLLLYSKPYHTLKKRS